MNQNPKLSKLINSNIAAILSSEELSTMIPQIFKQVFQTQVGGVIEISFEESVTYEDF